MDDFITLLLNEIKRADEKYGDWSDYHPGAMMMKITGELEEVADAYMKGDVTGEHGMKAELVQVACTSYKMWRALTVATQEGINE